MLRVFCGCSVVVLEIDNGTDQITETSGAECADCTARGGFYDKSPHWKEHVSTEESSEGNVIPLSDAFVSNKAKRREERRALKVLKRQVTGS